MGARHRYLFQIPYWNPSLPPRMPVGERDARLVDHIMCPDWEPHLHVPRGLIEQLPRLLVAFPKANMGPTLAERCVAFARPHVWIGAPRFMADDGARNCVVTWDDEAPRPFACVGRKQDEDVPLRG